MSPTAGKVISCKAAVAWGRGLPLSIETVEVAAPKAGEVRIKLVSTGVCHSDAYMIVDRSGEAGDILFPAVLGHEGAGIVESVGEGVQKFKEGDHVIPLYVVDCGDCRVCNNPNANFCQKYAQYTRRGWLPEGSSRFTCKGKPINQFMATSTFSEYTVVSELMLVKIDNKAPLDKVCLLGCGIPTGYGAAINTAKVTPGSICAVWGLGAVGLAAVMGCKAAGASRIIGIDINPLKFEVGKKFGCTEFVNPKDYDKPIQLVLMEMTGGGLDFSFECCGTVATMRAALESLAVGTGTAVIIGIANFEHDISTKPFQLIAGRTWKGSIYGGCKQSLVSKFVDDYMNKKLMVDEFITHTMKLDKINDAFDLMHAGKSIRSIIIF